ncbi:uncharacterized protein L199_001744 [Kwoniella botswanensis]|uniref:uncharacterized protein n=1 Tax=Kwoniella botswanensis TaxID=1268659 RepID=UPI00315C735D
MGKHHSSRHHSSGRQRSHRDDSTYDRYRRGCNPLSCCKCSFGGKTAQSILLIFLPFSIAVICFLAGFWLLPVWVYDGGYQGDIKIAAQGYGVNGQDSGTREFLYSTASWPDPMSGFPLLLLFHLILSILLITYLVLILAICAFASFIDDRMHALDNVVWGLARSKGHDLNPDILGYFVNIVALCLWVFWVVAQCASTHDIKEYYVTGGGRVRTR